MANSAPPTSTDQEPRLNIWDTRDDFFHDPFDRFREATRTANFPWSQELNDDQEFIARVERIDFEEGVVAQVRSRPHIAVRNNREVGRSAQEGYLVLYMLGGQLNVEQGGRSDAAKQGDLIIFDTARPCKMFTDPMTAGSESVALFAAKHCFDALEGEPGPLSSLVLKRDRLAVPLVNCLSFLSQNIRVGSPGELNAIFNACVSLLSVAGGCNAAAQSDDGDALQSRRLLREILDFVNRNIAFGDLSPPFVASKFGISNRYLHRLFADSGVTFGSHVLAQRLELVAGDLISSKGRNVPIASLAYDWGFGDISTFNKAFRKRFGCSPRTYRARWGC
jgi:AraC family transcriptional regulator, positive regulator of tynA and feaB